MRLRFWRFLALATSAATVSALAGAGAFAAWSHHPVSSTSSSTPPVPVSAGGTTTTTTTTMPSGFTGTITLGSSPPISAYIASGNGSLGTGVASFVVTTQTPPTTSTTSTTVSKNQNGSTTTTNTTTVTAATPQVTTTTLANPPPTTNQTNIQVNIPGFGPTTVSKPVVTTTTQPSANGGTTTNLTVTGTITGPVAEGCCGSRSVSFNLTETAATVALAPVAPTQTVQSSTVLPEQSVFPRGSFGATEQPETVAFEGVEAEVKAASDAAQAAIAACGVETPSCVADALDAYADALEKLAPRLPPRLRTLPGIIRNAAHKIRIAKTPAEAVRAVKAAIVAVHKTISLLRADDPATRQVGTREGTLVVETLQVASNKLEKAVGL